MKFTKNTLTGLFMVATFIATLIGLNYSEGIGDFLASAQTSVDSSAHAEATTNPPPADDGWEFESSDSSSSSSSSSDDGWSMEISTPATGSAGGNAACCGTSTSVASGDACCSTEGKGLASGHGSLGLFDVTKISEYKASGDWCTAHGVPESMCVKCNPDLIAQFKERGDWCAGHDLPESLCPLCHKELAAAGIGRDWCPKHGMPASQCTICKSEATMDHNGLTIPQAGRLENALQISVEETARELTPSVGPALFEYDAAKRKGIDPNCLNHLSTIKFESSKIQEQVDLRNQPVVTQPVYKTLKCYGEVRYDENNYALISSLGGGVVKEVLVDLGDEVRKGDVLAIVDSVEFGKAKADFLRAAAQVQRWQWLNDSYKEGQASGAIAKKEIIEAQAELDAAQVELAIAAQTLRNFGLDDQRIEKIQEGKDTDTHLEVVAPFDATLVARKAVNGENVEPGQSLFEIADLSTMWLMLSVFAEDLGELSKGMPVAFQPEGEKGTGVRGEITWISPNLDEKTRTASVRAELNNPDKQLRKGLFGTGVIGVHEGEQMMVVPKEAIQWDGCCNMAFVQTKEGEYQPRKVRLGDQVENGYVILAGLSVGESVATQGSYLLKTEVLKSQIGAGCCGND
ncbi:MAG: efflux RND transporter periplasmic adaptor subunit [Candidatus Omnitrophica bacterium]|nr:efflux RND transporter periplasmic adaptor subunit [Candidatus Omnitrophota bacterium]